jgi:hypothetical protein
MSGTVRVAAIQQPPVLLDRDATLRKAVEYLAEAAPPTTGNMGDLQGAHMCRYAWFCGF